MAYPFHPIAELFPLMDEECLADLAADIVANGLREPIVSFEGLIIDGRNRFIACERVGVSPTIRPWEGQGSDLVAYVVSLNLHRRHLDTGQRGMVAARIANMAQGERTDLSANAERLSERDAARLLNVSVDTVTRARIVRAHGTSEQIAAVDSGKVSVSRMATEVRQLAKTTPSSSPRKSRAAVAGRLTTIQSMAGDGYTTRQIAASIGLTTEGVAAIAKNKGIPVPADRIVGRAHTHKPTRIIEQMAMSAEHLTADVNLIDFAQVTSDQLAQWIVSFRASHRALGVFIRRLETERKAR